MNNIEKVLSISTAHITEDTDRLLSDSWAGRLPFRHSCHDYGHVIWVPGEDYINDMDFSLTPEIKDILFLAYNKGCNAVILDRDAGTEDGLKYFNW